MLPYYEVFKAGYLAQSCSILVHLVSVFLIFGIALHGTPVAYVTAIRKAAKQTGPNRLAAHTFLVPSGGH
jgi:short subunit fatty acids transporter